MCVKKMQDQKNSPCGTLLKKSLKHLNFIRRKTTSSPEDTEHESDTKVETTTSKFSRRQGSKFKSRKELDDAKQAGKSERRPSLNSGAASTERPIRNAARRRKVGANVTSTSTSPSPLVKKTQRPYRLFNRRRPLPTTSTIASEENDDVDDDPLEDLAVKVLKDAKIQRRPLVHTINEDQNPAATNEGKRKRQNNPQAVTERKSKKFSASIKKNQLEEVLKRSKSSEEVDDDDTTTVGTWTTSDDLSAETAVAVAAHQLLTAPPPIETTYDDNGSQTTGKPKATHRPKTQYRQINPSTTTNTEVEDYSTTPIYSSTPDSTTYTSRRTVRPSSSVTTTKSTPYPISPFPGKTSKPSGFTKANNLSALSVSQGETSISPAYSRVSQSPSLGPGFDVVSQSRGPSTARYLGSNGKPIPVPVEDYSLSPGHSSLGESSLFTREYLLESPVTKTYDDEYQYLSPLTTPRLTGTRKISKKISTTIPPTSSYTVTSPKPRRIVTRKPFEKVPKSEIVGKIKHTYRPIDNFDYYDEGDAKMGNKYEEGTKVVLHGKGTIECLDIGNFPHPSSCKKFISCARIDNGSILGWEYICPKGLSFDPVGGICNWSAGLGCDEKDVQMGTLIHTLI